jgi:hypothetical protein
MRVFRREGLFFALQEADEIPLPARFNIVSQNVQGRAVLRIIRGPQNSEASTHLAYIKILACCDISRYL